MKFTSISFDPVEIGHDTNKARVVGLCLIGFRCAKNIWSLSFHTHGLAHLTRLVCVSVFDLINLHLEHFV